MFARLDNVLQRTFGLPYLFASRDFNIHSRCRYLLHRLGEMDGQGLSLLDVGCGAGITLRHLATLEKRTIGRYVGIDRQAERLYQRYGDVTAIDVAFRNVDLDDDWDLGRFDLIWCSEVIEHLMDDAGQISKMKRALKPGGVAMITTPCLDFVEHVGMLFPPILKTSATQDGGHVRHGYRVADMERLAVNAGFEIESIDGVNPLTLTETEKRYTTSGAAWVLNNIRMNLRARMRRDFALGDAFKAEPARFSSIAAVLRRPLEAEQARPAPETIRVPTAETERAAQPRTLGSLPAH